MAAYGATRAANATRGNVRVGASTLHAFRDVHTTWTNAFTGERFITVSGNESGSVRVGVTDDAVVARAGGWRALDCAAAPDGVFFVIDTSMDNAWFHWWAESAAFLRAWSDLVRAYPGVRLVLRRPRGYKTLVLRALGIGADRVLYADGGDHDGPTGAPLPRGADGRNLVFFPPVWMHNFQDGVDLPFAESHQAWLAEHLRERAGVRGCGRAPRGVLVMPRGSKENLPASERRLDFGPFSRVAASGRAMWTLLQTDNVTDFLDQVRAIAGAKVIVVSGGSASKVAGMLARDATIFIVGPMAGHQGYMTNAFSINFAAGHNSLRPLGDVVSAERLVDEALAVPDDAARCGDEVPACYSSAPPASLCWDLGGGRH